MKNKGIIRKINENIVDIEIYKDFECVNCSKCNSKSNSIKSFSLLSSNNLSIGDIVEFEISNRDILIYSSFIYAVPTIFMFGGYGLASFFKQNEILKILSCFLGLFLSFIFIYIFDKIKGKKLIDNINITKETY